MNAPANITVCLHESHRDAVERANAWRGRCVNLFARGEAVIGHALVASTAGRPLPMLLSQRISRLRKSAAVGANQELALDEFSALASERNAIVHGTGKVFVERSGRWFLVLETLGRTGPSETTFSQSRAEERGLALKQTVDRLSARFPR
jgi:hypothetical protein